MKCLLIICLFPIKLTKSTQLVTLIAELNYINVRGEGHHICLNKREYHSAIKSKTLFLKPSHRGKPKYWCWCEYIND